MFFNIIIYFASFSIFNITFKFLKTDSFLFESLGLSMNSRAILSDCIILIKDMERGVDNSKLNLLNDCGKKFKVNNDRRRELVKNISFNQKLQNYSEMISLTIEIEKKVLDQIFDLYSSIIELKKVDECAFINEDLNKNLNLLIKKIDEDILETNSLMNENKKITFKKIFYEFNSI